MTNQKIRVWLWLVVSFILIGIAIFLAAGTIDYWQAWVYLGVGAVTIVPLMLLITRNPVLLENRASGGPTAEQRRIQKIIVLCAGLPAIAAFIVPGLDHRFGWSSVPLGLALVGDLLILL